MFRTAMPEAAVDKHSHLWAHEHDVRLHADAASANPVVLPKAQPRLWIAERSATSGFVSLRRLDIATFDAALLVGCG